MTVGMERAMNGHFSCDYEYAGGTHMQSMSRHWLGDKGTHKI